MSTRESQGRSGNGSERGGCSKPVTGVRPSDKESLRDHWFTIVARHWNGASGKCDRQEEYFLYGLDVSWSSRVKTKVSLTLRMDRSDRR